MGAFPLRFNRFGMMINANFHSKGLLVEKKIAKSRERFRNERGGSVFAEKP